MCPNKCGSQKGWCENSAGHYTAPNHARCGRMARMQSACGNRRTQVGKQPTPLESLLLVHQASCKTCCRNMAEQMHGHARDQRLRCHVLNTCGFPKTASPRQGSQAASRRVLGTVRGQAPCHPFNHGFEDLFIAGLFDDDVPALWDDVQLLVGRGGALIELPGAVHIAQGVVFAVENDLPSIAPCSLALRELCTQSPHT